jgi:hypothetical protein
VDCDIDADCRLEASERERMRAHDVDLEERWFARNAKRLVAPILKNP